MGQRDDRPRDLATCRLESAEHLPEGQLQVLSAAALFYDVRIAFVLLKGQGCRETKIKEIWAYILECGFD